MSVTDAPKMIINEPLRWRLVPGKVKPLPFLSTFITREVPDRSIRGPDVGRINHLAASLVTPFHIVEVARCAHCLLMGLVPSDLASLNRYEQEPYICQRR